jgi:hypothetical protein
LKRHPRTFAVLAAATGASLALILGGTVQAQAATSRSIGNITCSGKKEIHTVSRSKGQAVHQVYGGWQIGAAWPTTSSRSPGYSSTYASWDQHHWMYWKNQSGGRVKSSVDVTSGSIQCK